MNMYKGLASKLRSAADTAGSEAFNPYSKGGQSAAMFSAYGQPLERVGGLLSNYANEMQSYKKSQANKAATEKANLMKKAYMLATGSEIDPELQQYMESTGQYGQYQSRLSEEENAKAQQQFDDLKTQIASSLYGKSQNGQLQYGRDDIARFVSAAQVIDSKLINGDSPMSIYDDIDSYNFDPLMQQSLREYAQKIGINAVKSTPQPQQVSRYQAALNTGKDLLSGGINALKSYFGR